MTMLAATSAEAPRYLDSQKILLKGHPPYSPDLAPNDFYLFATVKNKLCCQCLSKGEEAVDAFKMHVLEDASFWMEKVPRKLVKTYAKVVIVMANIWKAIKP